MDNDPNKTVVWPHAEGIARCAFSPDGNYLYTSGAEGYIRVFDTNPAHNEPEPAKVIEYHEEPNTGLSTSNDLLCSSNESGVVALHRHGGTHELVELATRCSSPVRSARFDPKGKRIAVASDELIVKIINVSDPINGVQLLPGHRKGVREATWSPDGQLLTTSGSEGQIRVWDLTSSEPTCIQTLENIIDSTDPESEYSVEVVWHPNSKYFVVPSKHKDVVIYSRETWTKVGTLLPPSSGTEQAGQISSLAFSVNGLYLATAMNDLVHIWNFNDRKIVSSTKNSQGVVTGLAFQPTPKSNLLVSTHITGQLIMWRECVPKTMAKPSWSEKKAAQLAAEHARRREDRSESVGSKAGDAKEDAAGEDGYFADDLDGWLEDEDGENAGKRTAEDEDREGDEDEDEEMDGAESRLNGVISKYERAQSRGDRAGSTSRYLSKGSYSSGAVGSTKGQEPFQPGSTHFREQRRYLAFNLLGLIHVVEREDQNIVTVEFHDRSAGLGTHFNDSFKFSMAALGELGSVYAVKGNSTSPSLIYYKPFESWTSTQDWQYSLPEGENAIALSVGGLAPAHSSDVSIAGTGTVVVATDRGYVRFLTGSGLQKYIWNLGESVIATSAGKDWAMVVYRAGGTVPGLDYALIDTDSFEVLQQGKLPLMKDATLAWIGMTDEQIPVMYDSNGTFSILDRSRRPRQARWVPVLETAAMARRENKQETYWPIGLTSQHAHVIILKGEEIQPHFPTPLIQELDLQLPLLRLDVQQGQLEETALRESCFISHRKDGADPEDYELAPQLAKQELAVDKALLNVIQTACKAERLEQALDATLMLSQTASLVAAAKIARFFNLPGLEERVQLVQELKEAEKDGTTPSVREGKWSHLVDDRNVRAPGAGANPFGGNNLNVFAGGRVYMPPSSMQSMPQQFSYRQSLPPQTQSARKVSSDRRKTSSSAAMDRIDSGFADAYEDDDEMIEDGENEREASEGRAGSFDEHVQLDEPMYDSPAEDYEPVVPVAKKKSNPFRKSTPPPAGSRAPVSPANPFASKKSNAAKAADLHRTGSFFNRVEGKEGPKTKGAKRVTGSATTSKGKTTATIPGTKQTTLFGFAPVAEEGAPEKPSKKRTSTAAEVEEDNLDLPQPFAKPAPKRKGSTAGLGGQAQELPREGEEFEETQLATQEESLQPVPKKSRSSAPPSQEELETLEPTQVEDTQGSFDTSASSAKENIASVPIETGKSKLDKYRMAAAPTAVDAPPATKDNQEVEPIEVEITSEAVVQEEAVVAE